MGLIAHSVGFISNQTSIIYEQILLIEIEFFFMN